MYLEFYMGISLNQPLYFWNNFLSVNKKYIYVNLKFQKKKSEFNKFKKFFNEIRKIFSIENKRE